MHNIIKSNVKSYKPLRTAIKYMFTVTLSIILIQTFIKANNNENNKKNPALFRVFNSLHALGSMLYYYTLPSGLFLHVHWLEICNKTDIYKKRKKNSRGGNEKYKHAIWKIFWPFYFNEKVYSCIIYVAQNLHDTLL